MAAGLRTCRNISERSTWTKPRNVSAKLTPSNRWCQCSLTLKDALLLIAEMVDGFCQLVNYIEPNYLVHLRPHIQSICQKLYASMKEKLLFTLQSHYVALTSDLWTFQAVQAYLTVPAHFITEEWALESSVPEAKEIPEHHTGRIIGKLEYMQLQIEKWHHTGRSLAVCFLTSLGFNIAERLKEAAKECYNIISARVIHVNMLKYWCTPSTTAYFAQDDGGENDKVLMLRDSKDSSVQFGKELVEEQQCQLEHLIGDFTIVMNSTSGSISLADSHKDIAGWYSRSIVTCWLMGWLKPLVVIGPHPSC